MNTTSITDKIRQQYINDYLECTQKINYKDFKSDKLIKVLYKDLPKTVINGYPIASDFVSPDGKSYSITEYNGLPDEEKQKCELCYYYLPYLHELYVGTTGSGKTTGCVVPQLRAISSQKNKPNLFLTDPKGELFDKNAKHLIDNGYKTYVLNFKDLVHSDKWNPMLELYSEKMKLLSLGKSAKFCHGKIKPNLKLANKPDEYSDSFGYIDYEGYAFASQSSFDKYLKFETDYVEANLDSLINQFANMIINPQSHTDLSWEYGAQELLKGLLKCMLEDAIDPTSGFTSYMMNFRTLQQYYQTLRSHVLHQEINLFSDPLLSNKSRDTVRLMATALNNAPNTMKSYCGVFDGATKDWFKGHIFALTAESTINLDDIGDQPFAIFLITRDYEKSDFVIAGLFIDWVYRKMLEKAEHSKNPRALHFLLDEFGNIPQITDFENKISTSRSRNIWFHLVVQSYKQLDNIYGDDKSVIIRDNCNSQIFLGAQHRETKEIFSRECGKHYIPTLNSLLDSCDSSIVEVPVVPVSDLDLITPGQMYVKRLYSPVIVSQFVRSYDCADLGIFKDYNEAKGLSLYTPTNCEPFSSDKYTYDALYEPIPTNEDSSDWF